MGQGRGSGLDGGQVTTHGVFTGSSRWAAATVGRWQVLLESRHVRSWGVPVSHMAALQGCLLQILYELLFSFL